MKKKLAITFIGLFLIITVILLNIDSKPAQSKNEEIVLPSIEHYVLNDFEQAVNQAVEKMPYSFHYVLTEPDYSTHSEVRTKIHEEKIAFRNQVENQLFDLNQSTDDIEQKSKERAKTLNSAIDAAEEQYGITVTEDEINTYIEDNIAPVKFEQKDLYANALGITQRELDFVFDRDIYLMDVLWDKLMPALKAENPRQDDESSNEHSQRLKETFYSNAK